MAGRVGGFVVKCHLQDTWHPCCHSPTRTRCVVPCRAALQALLTPATVVPANLTSTAGVVTTCPAGTVIVGFRLLTISLTTQGINLQRYAEAGLLCK